MLLSGLDPDRRDQVNSSTRDAAQVRPVGAARGQASSARKGCEKGTGQEVPRRRGDVQRPADTADPGEEERARGPHSLGESAFPTLLELRAGTRLLTNNARAPSAVTRLPAPPRLICCCARDAPEPFGGKSCYHQEQSAGPDSRQAGGGGGESRGHRPRV